MFRTLEEALKCLEVVGYAWTSLPLNNPGGTQARFRSLLRPDGTPLRCLVIALEHQAHPQRRAYLFEKERIGKEYGPLLLALPEGNATSGEGALEELLETRAFRTTWPQTHPGFRLVHLPHGFSSIQTFARGILRALGFPDDAFSPHTSTPLPSRVRQES